MIEKIFLLCIDGYILPSQSLFVQMGQPTLIAGFTVFRHFSAKQFLSVVHLQVK